MLAEKTFYRSSPEFPSSLRDISGWPSELYCLGSVPGTGQTVAIVGARAASRQGMERARSLAGDLCDLGHAVVSGGALGVDAAAHEGALAVGGYTVAVMACGLDQMYPRRNQDLFDRIVRSGGAIVSPYRVGDRPLRGRFVRRNQIIAALADLVVVVEAGIHSGSLHTARFSVGLGRKLAVIPGSPGCESLRASGIPAVHNISDVREVLDGQNREICVPLPPPNSSESRTLGALSMTTPKRASDLGATVDLPLREIQRALARLHLDLLAVALPGQRFLRSQLAQRALERSE